MINQSPINQGQVNHSDILEQILPAEKNFVALIARNAENLDKFWAVDDYITAAKKTGFIDLIFSAIQRLDTSYYKDFQAHLLKKEVRAKLLNIPNDAGMRFAIQSIRDDYNKKYSMPKLMLSFFSKYLGDDDKESLNNAFNKYRAKVEVGTEEDRLKSNIKELLVLRNLQTHNAIYSFSRFPEIINNNVYGYDIFEEFYRVSVIAIKNFWVDKVSNSS